MTRVPPPLLATAPVALAIFAFGTIYGASQTGIGSPLRAVVSSALVFSGAAQLAAGGLLATGAGAGAILATVAVLNLRHLVLGAVLRQRMAASAPARLALAFLLIDETVGLAVSARENARVIYLVAGIASYVAWVGGTAVGAYGGAVLDDPVLAEAVFPVLFVGLASTAVRDRGDVGRALAAVAGALGLGWLLPGLGGLVPILVAVALALIGGRR